jgi:hypothetical protein
MLLLDHLLRGIVSNVEEANGGDAMAEQEFVLIIQRQRVLEVDVHVDEAGSDVHALGFNDVSIRGGGGLGSDTRAADRVGGKNLLDHVVLDDDVDGSLCGGSSSIDDDCIAKDKGFERAFSFGFCVTVNDLAINGEQGERSNSRDPATLHATGTSIPQFHGVQSISHL